MNPNPSREFQLIDLELAALNARTIQALQAQGFPYEAIQTVTACYYEQVRMLQASYQDEAIAHPVPPQSTKADAWPTVDTVDLHLPKYPAPDCKVVGVVRKLEAVVWEGDGYYHINRMTGIKRCVRDKHVAKAKGHIEAMPKAHRFPEDAA